MAFADPLRRKAPDALPVTLLTGFLGAGKTTLLNRLVAAPELAHAVVIINEFGEIAIDHLLVEAAEGGLLTLSSGCLCCTVRGDLVDTLEDLLRRRDNGRIAAFDRVVIETTGLADPAPVLNAIVAHPYLMLRYRIDGVVTMIDAVNGMASLDTFAEALKQAAIADCLVLSKTDLCGAETLAPLRQRLRALNPAADLLDAGAGEALPRAILEASLFRNAGRLEASTVHHGASHDHGHGEDDHSGHGHAEHDHDSHIDSFALTAEAALQPAGLELFVELLRARFGPALLRVKGLVRLLDDLARPLLIQGVQHLFHPPRRLPAWPDQDRRTRLVLIGRDLDQVAVERLWSACCGSPAIDRPDGAALASPFAEQGKGLF